MQNLIPFLLPLIGLLWLVGGMWQSLRIPFGSRGSTDQRAAHADTARRKAQRSPRKALLSGGGWILLGSWLLWQSDFGLHVWPQLAAQQEPPAGASPESDSSDMNRSDTAVHRLRERVTELVERDFEEHQRVGMVVGVVTGTEEFLLGFGKRKLGAASVPDANTAFEIGSISKVFTGVMLARRIEQGTLKLDDRVVDLLPDDWSLPPAAHQVTLKQLTTHTSGLPRMPANLLGFTKAVGLQFGIDPHRNYTEEEFRRALADLELLFEPGAKHEYSNFGVCLLGHLLALQAGSDYESLLQTEICEPLKLQHTTTLEDDWQREHLAKGYRAAVRLGLFMPVMESINWQFPGHIAGAGGIRSTGEDMLRFLQANMGFLESPLDAALERSHAELFRLNERSAIGMNWLRTFQESLSMDIVWHNGGTGGYRSFLGFTQDRCSGVVILSNTAESVDGLAVKILEAVHLAE